MVFLSVYGSVKDHPYCDKLLLLLHGNMVEKCKYRYATCRKCYEVKPCKKKESLGNMSKRGFCQHGCFPPNGR